MKTIVVLICLTALAGCGGGMSRAYDVLPNTLDDLAQKTKAFRHHEDGTDRPQSAPAPGAGGRRDRSRAGARP